MNSVKHWLIAAILGATVALVLGGLTGLVAGISIFIILGVVLKRMQSSSAQESSDPTTSEAEPAEESTLADARPEEIAVQEDQAVMAAIQERIVQDDQPDVQADPSYDVGTGTEAETQPVETIETTASAADDGYTDDLTLIEGLPEKFALGLHEIGITTFDQIAGWTEEDIAEVTEKLGIGRKQRIANQQWVEQAQALLEKGA